MSVPIIRSVNLLKALEKFTRVRKRWDIMNTFSKVEIFPASDGCVSGIFRVTDDICDSKGTLHEGFSSSLIDVFSAFGVMQNPRWAQAQTEATDIAFLGSALKGQTVRVAIRPLEVREDGATLECMLTSIEVDSPVARGTILAHIPE